MNPENTAEKKIMYAVITNRGAEEFVDDGYESFNDTVDVMMNQWRMLTVQDRVEIAKRDYRDVTGADYMACVGFYDDDPCDCWGYISLAEVMPLIEAMEEEEEEENE